MRNRSINRKLIDRHERARSVGDDAIEALRLKLTEGIEPVKPRHECLWCCRAATTRYLGRQACDEHENLLQQLAIENLTREGQPLVGATGGIDRGED